MIYFTVPQFLVFHRTVHSAFFGLNASEGLYMDRSQRLAKKLRDPSRKGLRRPSDIHVPAPKPLINQDSRDEKLTQLDAGSQSEVSPELRSKIKAPVEKRTRPEPDTLHDYNIVCMTEFKQNPSAYMLRTGSVPLAITRYGRIDGMLLTVTAYNELIAKIRDLRAELAEYQQLLETTDPELADFNKNRPRETMPTKPMPNWPMFKQLPRRQRSGMITAAGLNEVLEQVRLLNHALQETHDEMVADPTDAWQQIPRDSRRSEPEVEGFYDF
jgi:hypothetical protein